MKVFQVVKGEGFPLKVRTIRIRHWMMMKTMTKMKKISRGKIALEDEDDAVFILQAKKIGKKARQRKHKRCQQCFC